MTAHGFWPSMDMRRLRWAARLTDEAAAALFAAGLIMFGAALWLARRRKSA
jgi:LPXTG-motif cell wall-anchored protein